MIKNIYLTNQNHHQNKSFDLFFIQSLQILIITSISIFNFIFLIIDFNQYSFNSLVHCIIFILSIYLYESFVFNFIIIIPNKFYFFNHNCQV
jgi:hypothetical protein